jgi:release factor glutamine methyltransferase
MTPASFVLRPSSGGEPSPVAGRPSSLGAALRQATRLLAHTDAPAVTAQALLGQVLGLSRAQVLARPEQPLSVDEAAALDELVARAAAGEPLAYLTGTREFCGLDFEVDVNVLVPRPETELLVELALRLSPAPRRIVDVGTGSGCIAVTLARRLPEAAVTAVDISPGALALARRNAERHGVAERLTFIEGDLLEPIASLNGNERNAAPKAETFDLIVANLPYIDTDELRTLPVARHEPWLALDGGPGGLELVEHLLAQAPAVLAPGGTVLLEIGAGQGQRAAALGRAAFPGAAVRQHPDLAGLDRVLAISLSEPCSV